MPLSFGLNIIGWWKLTYSDCMNEEDTKALIVKLPIALDVETKIIFK